MRESTIGSAASGLSLGPPRIAMFVFNTCHNDARVRKEARTLGEAGYEVRVFAIANANFPAGIVDEGCFSVHRLYVESAYQRILAWISRPASSNIRRIQAQGTGRIVLGLGWIITRPFVLVAKSIKAVASGAQTFVQYIFGKLAWSGRSIRRIVVRMGRAMLRGTSHDIRRPGSLMRVPRHDRRAISVAVRALVRFVAMAYRTAGTAVGIVNRLMGRQMRRLARSGRSVRRTVVRWMRRGRLALFAALRKTIRRRLIYLHRPTLYLAFWEASARAALDWEPDAVHAHDLNALPAAIRVKRKVRSAQPIPVVYDSHELWRHRNRVTRFHPVGIVSDAVQERRLIRECSLVVTVGNWIEAWLASTYKLPDDRTLVIRNLPIQNKGFSIQLSLRALASLGPNDRILLYIGRITTGRGLEEAVGALPFLPGDVHLVILGYGDEEFLGKLRVLAAGLGCQDRLRHAPAVRSEDVPSVAAEADAALVAMEPSCLSYKYSLPNKLFESIQAGLPVVACDLPEIADVVKEFGVGALYSSGDSQDLARVTRKVLAAPGEYRRASKEASGELCWERESEALVAAYTDLIPPAAVRFRTKAPK